MLACSEVKPQLDKMLGLKRDKGMAGIHDLIDWTLAQVGDVLSVSVVITAH